VIFKLVWFLMRVFSSSVNCELKDATTRGALFSKTLTLTVFISGGIEAPDNPILQLLKRNNNMIIDKFFILSLNSVL